MYSTHFCNGRSVGLGAHTACFSCKSLCEPCASSGTAGGSDASVASMQRTRCPSSRAGQSGCWAQRLASSCGVCVSGCCAQCGQPRLSAQRAAGDGHCPHTIQTAVTKHVGARPVGSNHSVRLEADGALAFTKRSEHWE